MLMPPTYPARACQVSPMSAPCYSVPKAKQTMPWGRPRPAKFSRWSSCCPPLLCAAASAAAAGTNPHQEHPDVIVRHVER